MRIDGGEDDRGRPQRPEVGRPNRRRRHVLDLTDRAVVARDLAAVDDVAVQRIGHGVAVLLDADRMPLAERDHPVVAAARHAGRAAFLLPATHVIGERVVGIHVIHLRGGLVVPGAPGLAAVHADDRALVARHRDDVRVIRVDPGALIVVAAGRAAQRHPALSAVLRPVADGARDDDRVRVLRIDRRDRQIAAADAARRPRVGSDAHPVLAGVVGSVDADGARVGDGCVNPIRIARRDRDVRLNNSITVTARQTIGERPPVVAAVGRLEDAAIGAGPRAVFPRSLPLFPEARVNNLGIARIELQIRRSGVLVLRQDLLERAAAVGGSIHAALVVRPVRVSEHRYEQPIRVVRIDDDVRDLLTIAQAEVRPGLAGVDRFVDAVTYRQVRPREPFAAADVDDVWIGRRDGNRADRAGRLIVEGRQPCAAEIGGLPDAAVHRADVEDIRRARDAGDGLGPPAAKWSDRAPAQSARNLLLVEFRRCWSAGPRAIAHKEREPK